jgi:hypothetical protein
MVRGIELTLLIGPAVPIPAPREVVEALTSVEVRSSASGPTGFELQFNVGRNSLLQTLFLLKGAAGLTPPLRVILIVTMNGRAEVISDGIMTDHVTRPGSAGQASTVSIMGTDLSALMNLIPFDGVPYPAMPVEARVLMILGKYAVLGIIPRIIPRAFTDVPNPLDIIPRHQGTDLEYLEQLADEAGYKFYVEPGPIPLTNIAHWGPEVKVGVPQPALTMNSDFETNVDNIQFTFRNDRQEMPVVMIHNRESKLSIPVPVPDVSLINPPLGLLPPVPRGFRILKDTAKRSFPEAMIFGLSGSARTADCVTGNGSLDVLRYGSILRTRRLVGVRGAGLAFDGLHYVTDVTHSIKRGEYKQSFTLSRNGLVSTVPRVPV